MAQAPGPDPHWLIELQRAQQDIQQLPVDVRAARVERAWRAALQTPHHPSFLLAAQIASSFYHSQGFDLAAERALRDAMAAVPESDLAARRELLTNLGGVFESGQQLIKALEIREKLVNEPAPADAGDLTPPSAEATALAYLYERIGEPEKAEAAWKQVEKLRVADALSRPSPAPQPFARTFASRSFLRNQPNELAGFYARRGRAGEAEQIYKQALRNAAREDTPDAWIRAADSYANFLAQQRRHDEAIELLRQSIATPEPSTDPRSGSGHLGRHERLASVLIQAGRAEEAFEVRKQAAEALAARSPGGPQHAQALASLAQSLLDQNRLEEAEDAIARMRQAGAADPLNQPFHESMALQILARIREAQKRPEEARELRMSVGVPDLTTEPPISTVHDMVHTTQQAIFQGNADSAAGAVDRALAMAAERVKTNPGEISALFSLANVLMAAGRPADAERTAAGAMRLLEQAPDHPFVAEALGSAISPLINLGIMADARRALDRQEKILISAKGPDSPALNAVGYGRIALLQRDSNPQGVIDERKRMLARTEQATGPKSTHSLHALREVAWDYPALNNWPEEEQVLLTLRERTANLSGPSSLDHAQILAQMGNRAAQNRQFDKALGWMDQAIEIAQKLPEASLQLAGMMQERTNILSAKEGAPNGPFLEPQGSRGSPAGRWMNSDAFQRTDGARLGGELDGATGAGQPPSPAPPQRTKP